MDTGFNKITGDGCEHIINRWSNLEFLDLGPFTVSQEEIKLETEGVSTYQEESGRDWKNSLFVKSFKQTTTTLETMDVNIQ